MTPKTPRPPYRPAVGEGILPRSSLHIPMPPGTVPPRQQSPPAKPTGSVAWVSVDGADVFASVIAKKGAEKRWKNKT